MESVVKSVVDYLKNQVKGLAEKSITPMTNVCLPEIYISLYLGPEDAAYYHSLIGLLRWVFDLGRVDINVEASFFSCTSLCQGKDTLRSSLISFHISRST